MLKIKKIMATALVFIMILSLVTIPAMAEDEPFGVKYFNADSSKIIIDFNEEVDAEGLWSAISFTKDGEAVAFGVEYVEKTAGTTGELTVNGGYTYAVIPEDGLATDEIYALTISADLEAMDGCKLAQAYEKIFAVEKLWMDDFTYEGTIPWKTFSGTNNKLSIVDGTLKADLTSATASNANGIIVDSGNDAVVFGDTGMTAKSFFGSAFKNQNSYNTEIKVKANDLAKARGMNIVYQDKTTNLNTDYMKGLLGGFRVESSGTPYLSAMVFTNAYATNTRNIESNGSEEQMMASARGPVSSANGWENAETTLSIMSTNANNHLKVFADGVKAYGAYDYTDTVKTSAQSMLGLTFSRTQIYFIDYVLVTRVKEYQKANYTITPEDGATDVEIADEIKLTFEKPVDPASLSTDAVEVYVNDDLTNNYTVSVDEADANSVIVKLDEPMAYRAQYKVLPLSVKFTGDATDYMFISSSFETTMPDMEITELDINYVSGKYTAKATIQNNKIEDGIKGIMSVCLYDANGKMLDIEIQEIDVAMGDDATVIDQWDEYEEGEHYAKCYIWDGMTTMNTIVSALFE